MKIKNNFFYNFLREDKKTIKQRIINLICFVTPVITAFAGCLLSPIIWSIFSKKEVPEFFKFGCSIVFFVIPVVIIFVKTRNANPIMKIRVLDEKSDDSEVDSESK